MVLLLLKMLGNIWRPTLPAAHAGVTAPDGAGARQGAAIRTTAEGEVGRSRCRPAASGDIIEIALAPAWPPMPACSTPGALTRAP